MRACLRAAAASVASCAAAALSPWGKVEASLGSLSTCLVLPVHPRLLPSLCSLLRPAGAPWRRRRPPGRGGGSGGCRDCTGGRSRWVPSPCLAWPCCRCPVGKGSAQERSAAGTAEACAARRHPGLRPSPCRPPPHAPGSSCQYHHLLSPPPLDVSWYVADNIIRSLVLILCMRPSPCRHGPPAGAGRPLCRRPPGRALARGRCRGGPRPHHRALHPRGRRAGGLPATCCASQRVLPDRLRY